MVGSRGARVANGQERTRLAAGRWRRPHLRTGGSRWCEAGGRRRAASEGASQGEALRIWRVPRTAGVTGIQTCSPQRPVRQGKRERNGSVLTCLDGFWVSFAVVHRKGKLLAPSPKSTAACHGTVPQIKGGACCFSFIAKSKTAASSLPWVSFAESLLWSVEISPNLPSVRPG